MPKNMLHDVMTKERRSIRHVPLPSGRRGGGVEEDILYSREEYRTEDIPSSPWRRIFLWFATFLFVLLLGLAISTGFSGATLMVTPKTELVTVDHEFVASRGEGKGGALQFQALPVAETAHRELPADTTKKVTEKAAGTIVIYNNFSEKSQRLRRNTRFETKDGLTYRIGNSITVPGRTVNNGKVTPGSAETVVTADSPGAEYNIPLSDFTVPGFKSDPARFAAFYARSKTPMTGGFDGVIRTPSDSALAAARTVLREELEATAVKNAGSAVPDEHILFKEAFVLSHESLLEKGRNGDLTTVKERVIGEALVFKRADIARALARALLPAFTDLPTEIPELQMLSFALRAPSGKEAVTSGTIKFRLKGNVRIVWLYDEEKLKSALVGKQKDALTTTLSSFPTIEKIDVVFRPFWSRGFPENPKKISIVRAPNPIVTVSK